MALSFTLDTNCIIAIDELRQEAHSILELVESHRTGKASVALVAISASERQKTSKHLESFSEFQSRIKRLGLHQLDMLTPMVYFDVTFCDYCL